jgi:hypothetical protein
MGSLMLMLVLALALASSGGAQPATAYQFSPSPEALPERPWHDTFIDETARTPEGWPNAGAAWLQFFLDKALENKLQTVAPRAPWERYSAFLSWAVWGYLSPDSKLQGDERLVTMSQVWLDTLFESLQTRPADPAAAEKWQPNRLDTWNLADYTLPLLEIEKRPELRRQIGAERVDKLRAIVLENIRLNTTPEAYNKLMGEAETYINIITHPMAVYVHGWLLTGERQYLQMAERIVQVLGRDQLPNGMFPYRYRIYGDRHVEYENMYYHAMNLRGLYLYWWATGSKRAEEIFRRSAPYYPLNLEPPAIFNGGADIWWKDGWRTFWPHHIAMVAAVTGDGENATLAGHMARHNLSHDRIDLVLGAHAYQLMGLREVQETPLRDGYLIADPDIRGLRLRQGRWSSTFTVSSFTFTRASALRVTDDQRSYSALHLARPMVRVAPLEKPQRTEADYNTLGREGADYQADIKGLAAAVATVYSPALTAATWQPEQPLAPWRMIELWLLTERGLVGLIQSTATAAGQARELCHQFRFIPPAGTAAGQVLAEDLYGCGDLRLRVWATSLPHRVLEQTRRYALSAEDRRDWQVTLTDTDRSPEHLAQTPPAEGPATALKLPALRDYPAGTDHYSLTEIAPTDRGFAAVELLQQGEVVAFVARTDDRVYVAAHNSGTGPAEVTLARPGYPWHKFTVPPGATRLELR